MPSQNAGIPVRGELFTEFADDVNLDTNQLPTHEGKEFYYDDKNFLGAAGGVVPDRSNNLVKCRLVRNKSGGVLLPKTFIKNTLGTTPMETLGRTGGNAVAVTDPLLGVVDEFLPAAGVPDGALFLAVVEGPTIVKTSVAAVAITVGLGVVPTLNGTATQAANQTNAEVRAFALVANAVSSTDCYIKLIAPRL